LEEQIGNYSQADYVRPSICVWSHFFLALIVLTNVVVLKEALPS